MLYSFHENFVLPLSHDEVVHGKGSLIGKMPGDEWQKFANLRLLFAYMFAQPGKKLLFMGCEFGQVSEWSHDRSLDWNVLEYPLHRGLMNWVEQLNRVYRSESPLHWFDNDPKGFEWVDCNDAPLSVISLLRKGKEGENPVLIACNFTPVPRVGYMVAVSYTHLDVYKRQESCRLLGRCGRFAASVRRYALLRNSAPSGGSVSRSENGRP